MLPIRSLTPQQATGNALATGFIAKSRLKRGAMVRNVTTSGAECFAYLPCCKKESTFLKLSSTERLKSSNPFL